MDKMDPHNVQNNQNNKEKQIPQGEGEQDSSRPLPHGDTTEGSSAQQPPKGSEHSAFHGEKAPLPPNNGQKSGKVDAPASAFQEKALMPDEPDEPDEPTAPVPKTPSASSRKKGFIITGIIVLILLGIIIGMRYFKKEEAEEPASSVVPVEVEEVQTGDVTKTVKLTGFVTPRSTAKLNPKLLAKVSTVNVDVGDRVSKGQVLATLDDSDIKAYQKAAEASLEAARLGVKAATTDLENAKRALEDTMKQFADSGVNLSPGVIPGGGLPGAELPPGVELPEIPEGVQLPEQLDKKDLERAKVDYKSAQADYALAEAKLKEAQNAMDSARQQADNTKITSPFDGVVAARLANPGDFANPIQPILVVIDDTEMHVAAGVTEKDINSVTPGMELKVLIKAVGAADASVGNTSSTETDKSTDSSTDPEQVFTGKVVTVSPVVDEKTRMFTVKVAIPNPGNKLRAGMSAEVYLPTAERHGVVRVPLDAVVDKGGHQVVYTIEESRAQNSSQKGSESSQLNSRTGAQGQKQYRARERQVETGLTGQDYIEIISGLTPGETIVTKGQHFLRDGTQVSIKKSKGSSSSVPTTSAANFVRGKATLAANSGDWSDCDWSNQENRPGDGPNLVRGTGDCDWTNQGNRPGDGAKVSVAALFQAGNSRHLSRIDQGNRSADCDWANQENRPGDGAGGWVCGWRGVAA